MEKMVSNMRSVCRGSCGNRRKCTVTDESTCSWSVYRYLRRLEHVSHWNPCYSSLKVCFLCWKAFCGYQWHKREHFLL